MKRLVAAGLVAAGLIIISEAGAGAAPQPPQTQAVQDEYVPVSQLPPASEQLPAAPLVVGAYGFIWIALLAYLWVIWRRLGAVDRELAELRRAIGARP